MYKQIYRELIIKAKLEQRKKGDGVYYESHHIIPDFMFKDRKRNGPKGHLEGNADADSNKVLLTFQEHLLAHYYLYEILKSTRYEYSAGSALQFFFAKATSGHMRQISLSDIDQKFLDKMSHLRDLGIQSISNARRGKLPAVDAKTGVSVGSIPTDHPKLISGEWQHHSKGKPGTKHLPGYGVGSDNGNYKEMTEERKRRVYECISKSIGVEGYLNVSLFIQNLKSEFTEFTKISKAWIDNNFGSTKDLVLIYNSETCSCIKFDTYFRSKEMKDKLKNYRKAWVTNRIVSKQIPLNTLEKFLKENVDYRRGRVL